MMYLQEIHPEPKEGREKHFRLYIGTVLRIFNQINTFKNLGT